MPAETFIPPEETGAIEAPKFSEFFEDCYVRFAHVLIDKTKDGSAVLDIGCGAGSAERLMAPYVKNCTITGVDSDEAALHQFQRDQTARLEAGDNHARLVCEDANDFLDSANISGQDTLILNATLHEINDPNDRENYLRSLFSNMQRIVALGGKVVIGDYYYEDSVTDEEVERFMVYQKSKIGHADARHKFVKPPEILPIAKEFGFVVGSEGVQIMQAVKKEQIDRKYYLICLENIGRKNGE